MISTQLTASAIVVWAIQYLKSAKRFRWMDSNTRVINRAASSIAALVSAAAIHWTFDPVAGTLTVTGLTIANLLHLIWAAFQQFVGQEILYEMVYHPRHREVT